MTVERTPIPPPRSARRTRVFGPAYLDRVLKVEGPLLDPALRGPVDESVDGRLEPGQGLVLLDPTGGQIEVALPEHWPGPTGVVRLSRPLVENAAAWRRQVRATGWHDDLGGMGAGFAAALGGVLVSALGAHGDPTSQAVQALLARAGVRHHPVRVAGAPADWTLLVTSGPHGDKLPIGFRGCHARLVSLELESELGPACDLRVVAALPNRLAAPLLRAPGAAVRFFAPAARNMLDRDPPVREFARAIDALACNEREWESLPDREFLAAQIPLLAITAGPQGSEIRFTDEQGQRASLRVPAFPRARTPRDTNRAGEAYAAELLATLLEAGWQPGPAEAGLVRRAAERASVAAALELDLDLFGFPDPRAIDNALKAGRVG